MDRKTRLNWLVLAIGFAVSVVLLTWLLPDTRWIVTKSAATARGERDVWSVTPKRIVGKGEGADLARALQEHGSESKAKALLEFHRAHRQNVEGLAHLCRIALQQSSPQSATVVSYSQIADLAREGAELEPDNLYWPMIMASVESERGNDTAAKLALSSARHCKVYHDYAIREAETVSAQAGRLTTFEGVNLYAGVVLPHFSHFRMSMSHLVDTGDDSRIDVALASITMTKTAETAITHLIAQGMAKRALMPAMTSNEKPTKEDYEAAATHLAEIKPEAKHELEQAVRLALRPAPTWGDNHDQFIFDQAAEGSALRLFLSAVAWLALTIVLIPVVPPLARMARQRWFAVVSPLVGFGVLAWLAWFPTGDPTMDQTRWIYHLAETTTIAILIGFLAAFDRLTSVVRWVLFALSLLTLPMALSEPILFVPLVTIWASLLAIAVLGERVRSDWPVGLLPTAVALPIALQLFHQQLAAMALWCVGALVLGLSIGKGQTSKVALARALAVSVALPAVAIVVAVWWNLRIDARLAGIFDGDRQMVQELRDDVIR